jgi:hypothetical protein
MSNPNRITKGEAIAGALISETSVTAEDLVATDDVTVGDDLVVTDDVSVGDDLSVTGDTTTATLKVGSTGTVVKTIKSGTGAIDLGSISAAETGSGTITITGAAAGDALIVNVPTLTTGLAFAGSNITSANTATLYFVNATANPIDNAEATFNYAWIDLT